MLLLGACSDSNWSCTRALAASSEPIAEERPFHTQRWTLPAIFSTWHACSECTYLCYSFSCVTQQGLDHKTVRFSSCSSQLWYPAEMCWLLNKPARPPKSCIRRLYPSASTALWFACQGSTWDVKSKKLRKLPFHPQVTVFTADTCIIACGSCHSMVQWPKLYVFWCL